MNDAEFNDALDALVKDDRVDTSDDLIRFVGEIYARERIMKMPLAAHNSQLTSFAAATGTSIESFKPTTRDLTKLDKERNLPRWTTMIAVAAAALLAMTGILRWSLPDGDNTSNRFLGIASAIPTVEATPSAIPAWMIPVSAEECPRDELLDANARVNPNATWYSTDDYAAVPETVGYGPFQPAEADDASGATNRLRQIGGCEQAIIPGNNKTLRIASPRYEFETRTTVGRAALDARSQQRREAAQDLSAWYESEMDLTPQDMMIHRPDSNLALLQPGESDVSYLYNPAHAVQLYDGRIALIVSMVGFGDEFPVDIANEPTFLPPAVIMIQIDGQWFFDEMLQLCIGECEAFWQDQASATPIAVWKPGD